MMNTTTCASTLIDDELIDAYTRLLRKPRTMRTRWHFIAMSNTVNELEARGIEFDDLGEVIR